MSRRLISPKIVRDNIPNFAKDNKHIAFEVMADKEFYIALKDKLVEESKELRDATSIKNEVEELADIFEVQERLIQLLGKSVGQNYMSARKQIQKVQKDKRSYKGGFKKNLFMISTAIIS